MSMKKLFALILALTCLAALSAAAEENRTITVTGTATVVTDADAATVTLGVISAGREAGEASAANAKRIEELIAALGEAGIEKKDISTGYYYVNARRDYSEPNEYGEYAIVGYEVSNSLTVTVRDIDRVGEVIDAALAGGANSCDGIQFSSTGAAAAQDSALKAAVGEARRRAEIMAESCGGAVGQILSVRENSSSAGIYVNSKLAFAEETAMDGAGTQILSDGLRFTASVEMTFELIGTDAASE